MDTDTRVQFDFLKQAQKEIKESIQSGTGKLEGKIDALALQFGSHEKSDAVSFQSIKDSSEQVRKDLDKRERDTEKRKDNRALYWVAIIGAAAAAIFTFAIDSMRHTEIQSKLEQIRVETKVPKAP